MAQKKRKVVVSFVIVLHEDSKGEKLKTLKERAKGEESYLGEAVGGTVKSVKVAEAE